jgi:hypothetical protein
MAKFEHRVVYKREGTRRKEKRFVRLATAQKLVHLLTSDEPWTAYGRSADAMACCHGWECGCEGLTVKQESDAARANYPPLEYVRIERRMVCDWEAP